MFVDDNRQVTDSISISEYAALYSQFERISFATLPRRLYGVPELCGDLYTDAPSVITTVFRRSKINSVDDYHGCLGSTDAARAVLASLRSLEDRVDSVTHASRWIKPFRIR